MPEEVNNHQKGKLISLTGYTSTSKNIQVAKEFALCEVPDGKIAVLYKIKFTGDEGLFFMSDPRFTAFEEDEVLVQDGLEYRIDSVKEVEDEDFGMPLTTVTLVYPANDKS